MINLIRKIYYYFIFKTWYNDQSLEYISKLAKINRDLNKLRSVNSIEGLKKSVQLLILKVKLIKSNRNSK